MPCQTCVKPSQSDGLGLPATVFRTDVLAKKLFSLGWSPGGAEGGCGTAPMRSGGKETLGRGAGSWLSQILDPPVSDS